MRVELSSDASSSLLPRFNNYREPGTEPRPRWKRLVPTLRSVARRNDLRGISASLAALGIITIAGYGIAPAFRAPTLATLYVFAVAAGTLRGGRWVGAIGAVASAILFAASFVPASGRFEIGAGWYALGIASPLAVALILIATVIAAREKRALNSLNSSHITQLCAFTQRLAEETKLDPIVDALQCHVRATFQREISVLLPGAGGLTQRAPATELMSGSLESEAASFAFNNDRETGSGTDHFSGSMVHFLPLKAWRGVVGVVCIEAADWEELRSESRQQLLRSFMSQAALAVTRADLVTKAQQAEVLQQADRLQKALLNSVSHNLRSPIASIMGALNSVLEDGELLDANTQQSLLQTAQEEAGRLNGLVQNLLDMTRLEGGAVRVKAEPCDVHDVVGSALQQLSHAVRIRQVSINIAPGLPLVPMDHVLIAQVLVNMLDNALKYSPAHAPVEISAKAVSGQLEVRVLDRGRGIPEEELDRIFEKFFRGSAQGARRGVGLGLSISKGFVEAHGGRIVALRRERGGTEIAFFLPLESNRG